MLRTIIVLFLALAMLSACEDMSDVRVATSNQIYEWMHGEPRPQPEPKILDSKYCYKVQADVLCYDTPQLGKEAQLVGSQ